MRTPLPFVLISCLLLLLPPSNSHVVFDEVGVFAGAVSYTHVAINVDFTSIQLASKQLKEVLNTYDELIHQKIKEAEQTKPRPAEDKIWIFRKLLDLAENRRIRLDRSLKGLENITHILPQPSGSIARTKRGVSEFFEVASTIAKTHDAIKKGYGFLEFQKARKVKISIWNEKTSKSLIGK